MKSIWDIATILLEIGAGCCLYNALKLIVKELLNEEEK